MDCALEVQTYGVMLHVFVEDVERAEREIGRALEAEGISYTGMREIEVRMEEAFISLIRRQDHRGRKPTGEDLGVSRHPKATGDG
jgi:hypothetical protein